MRKLIAAINMTLDGFCDHTTSVSDDEILQHYTGLLRNADTLLFGRITHQIMECYWPALVKKPTGNKATDDFALTIDGISKIVFSHTLKNVEWKSARLAKKRLKEEVLELREHSGKDIVVGSRSLIVTLLNLNLIDEFQITVQPIIAGKGLPLFEHISERIDLRLAKTKTFRCGVITIYYVPTKK